jgi:CBS domain-containing protein
VATTLADVAATPIGSIKRRPAVTVGPDFPLGEVVHQLGKHRRGSVLVEEGGRAVGICGERDIMLRVDHGDPAWVERPVREVMTPAPRTIREDEKIEDAINLMLAGGYRHLPIVDAAGTLLGIVSIRDLLVHIVGFFPAEFVNLPSTPGREASGPWGG